MAVRGKWRLGLELQLATEVRDRLRKMADRHRGNAGEGSLSRGVGGPEEAFDSKTPRAFGDGENTADPAQATVERQLPDGCGPLERASRHLLRCSEQSEGDRQVEARAFLPQLGRREVDRDAPRRKVQLSRGDPAANALPYLPLFRTSSSARSLSEPPRRSAPKTIARRRLQRSASPTPVTDG